MPQAKKPQKSAVTAGSKRRVAPAELRLKAVKLYVEEKLPSALICRELKVSKKQLYEWAKRYREGGEEGLNPREPVRHSCPPARERLRGKIVEVKQQQPAFGVKRISQWMRRMLFLQASPETVRLALHREGLMPKTKKKPPRNPPKPRFFERSTPNQLWQSDIFTFRLGGKNAYLIGFVDDYSRYIVGLGLYRSQTAENVLEVYRKAVGEYVMPKEMLTDQGRQYANWRGKTRFQMELAKDRIHHLMSRPHHPMTLGKVERFWKTIWEEFLVRAQFGSFEEAQERVRYWVQYYNHQRPHQGLDGLCPADRFFQIQQELRKVIEAGIQENAQTLALNRTPKEPFYMVGRMGGQSLVLRVEKGQFRMQVDDGQQSQQAQYTLGGKRHDSDGDEGEAGTSGAQCAGKSPGGAGLLDGAAADSGNLPGAEDHPEPAQPMAGSGDGGYIGSPGAEDGQSARTETGPAGEAGAAFAEENRPGSAQSADEAPHGPGAGEGIGEALPECSQPSVERGSDESRGVAGDDPAAGAGHHAGAKRPSHTDGGGGATGGVAQDLLPVGAPGDAVDSRGSGSQAVRTPLQAARRADGSPAETPGGAGGTGADTPAGGSNPDSHR